MSISEIEPGSMVRVFEWSKLNWSLVTTKINARRANNEPWHQPAEGERCHWRKMYWWGGEMATVLRQQTTEKGQLVEVEHVGPQATARVDIPVTNIEVHTGGRD